LAQALSRLATCCEFTSAIDTPQSLQNPVRFHLPEVLTATLPLCQMQKHHPVMVGGAAGIGPAWTRGEIERPAGTKNMGSWTAGVYTPEQQARLGVDEQGNRRGGVTPHSPIASPAAAAVQHPSAGFGMPSSPVGVAASTEHTPTMPGAGGGGIGPAWTRGEIEKPAGTRNMGSWTSAVYTPEQQARLGVDEQGNKTVAPAPTVRPAPTPTIHPASAPASTVHGVDRSKLRGLDIGTWAPHADSIGIEILRGQLPTAGDARAIIKAFGAAPKQFTASAPGCDLLGAPARQALMRLADSRHSPGQEDLKVELSLSELGDVVGEETVASLVALFNGRVDEVKLRRVEAGGERHVINFHTDVSLRTMQVTLNGEEEYEGGRVLFVTEDGVQQPPRPAGSAIIHDNSIPHGVTEMVRGTRYGLFFFTVDKKFAMLGA